MAGLTRRQWAAIGAVTALAGLAVGLGLWRFGGSGPRTHAAPPSLPPSPGPPPTEALGANTGLLFNSRLYGPGRIAAQLAALRHAGADVARSDAAWEAAEPVAPAGSRHRYSWSFDDTVAGSLAAQGLQWLPIIDYSPAWAQSVPGQDHSPPASAADYAAFAGALAARYGPDGRFWQAHPELHAPPVDTYEVWNEPDNSAFWKPAPDPARYAELYLQAKQEIASVQPQARVIVGGLTDPRSFLPALLTAAPALYGHLDGVAIHPYDITPQAVLARVRTARLALQALSLPSVPLYVTEFGFTTSPRGALDYLPERLRPGYIALTLAALSHNDCGVAAALLYAWLTPERNPADAQDWFGISPPSGGSTADTAGFAQGLRAARLPAAMTRVCG